MKGTRRCRVIKDYASAYPDPLVLSAGETVTIEERESRGPGWVWAISQNGTVGWTPARILDQEGAIGRIIEHYNATELTVRVGTELAFSRAESGWLWCTTPEGNSGWVPLENVEIIEPGSSTSSTVPH